jgi:peptidoglycan L-alanyl-D-glutamate endopeptidase CwlK
MASRSLDDLTPYMRERAIKFEKQCADAGMPVLIYCTLRSNEEQAELYASGRAKPGRIKTNARAGQSSHNPDKNGKSKAFDYVPMVGGKPAWDDKDLYLKTALLGEALGMKWAGRWSGRLRETAHFSEDGK